MRPDGDMQTARKKLVDKYINDIDGWIVFTDPGKPEKAKQVVGQLTQSMVSDERAVNEPPQQTRVIALPAQLDLRVIMEFVSNLKVLITPDTSIAHAFFSKISKSMLILKP